MSAEKKPPSWATVVWILGITFGAFGLIIVVAVSDRTMYRATA